MKDKKLKKIAQLVAQLVVQQMREYDTMPMKKTMYTGDWAEYDEEVSDKLRTMVLNLLNYRNNININISDNSFLISTDNLSGVKKSRSSSGLTKVSDDDYFSVEIFKETGFSINRGYNVRSQYLDSKIYDEILPLATNKLRDINSENFSDIWNDVMKESGLMRDNNIDELLKNIAQ
jgi:hypothetical protein